MIVPFFVYSSSGSGLLTGLSLTFDYYRRRNEDGTVTDLEDPVITELPAGTGRYEFTIPDASLIAGSVIDYVIDCTAAASPRFLEGHVDSDEALEEEEAEAGPGVVVFGVTPTTVRQDQFPQWTGQFSATSNPTSTAVGRWIDEAAAELAGILRLKASSAAAVFALGSSSAPFAWCRQTVTYGAAARVAKVITGTNPDFAKDLQALFDSRLKRLEEKGVEMMGPGISVSDDTDEPQGPTSHVDDLDLDVGEDDGNESELIPVLRRDDRL